MAKFFGLDIPAGLEERFFRIFRPTENIAGSSLTTSRRYASNQLTQRMRDISLFVKWEPLWDSFTFSRREAWHTYWGGWPGSGYSAFVEINAPRYKLGQELLLDPPSGLGPNLVPQGDFTSGFSSWVLYEDSGPIVFVFGGTLLIDLNDEEPPYIDSFMDSDWFEVPSGQCQLAVRIRIPSGTSVPALVVRVYDEIDYYASLEKYDTDLIADGEFYTYTIDFNTGGDFALNSYIAFGFSAESAPSGAELDFVSVRKYN